MFTRLKQMSVGTKVAIAAVAVVAVAGGVIALERAGVIDVLPDAIDERIPGGGAEPSLTTGENAAEAFLGGPDLLLYQNGDSLTRLDVIDQTEEDLGVIPASQLLPAPGSRFLAFQSTASTGRATLHLFDPESEETLDLGFGSSPVWHATGKALAYVRPEDPDCAGTDCTNEVVEYEVSTAAERVLMPIDRFALPMFWAGDYLLINDLGSGEVLSVDPSGSSRAVEIDPAVALGASPSGEWLMGRHDDGVVLERLSGGEPNGDPVVVSLVGEAQAASWAPDSSKAAVTVRPKVELNREALIGRIANALGDSPSNVQRRIGRNPSKVRKALKGDAGAKEALALLTGGGSTGESMVVVFDPQDPEPVMVEQSRGAVGPTLWSVDGKSVVLMRLVDPDQSLVQALHCPVASKGSCRTLLSWTSGLALLRME